MNKGMQRNSYWNGYLFIIIVGAMILMSIIPFIWAEYYSFSADQYIYFPSAWVGESGIYEVVGEISVFIASIVFFFASRFVSSTDSLHAKWLFCAGLVCLFIGLEEISWGQHWFGFSSPDILQEINFQGEVNLHNSKLIQSSNQTATGWALRFLVLYLAFLPLVLYAFPSIEDLFNRCGIPVPSISVALAVFIVKYVFQINFIEKTFVCENPLWFGEIPETMLEICILLFAVESFKKVHA